MSESSHVDPKPAASAPTARSGPAYPFGAVLLNFAGALLIILEGVYLVSSHVNAPFNDFVPTGLLIPSAQALGYLACLEGAAILVLALWAYAQPEFHTVVGIGSLTLALLSLYSGGGFLAGATLAWVGGILAIYHRAGWSAAGMFTPEDLEEDPVIEADVLAAEAHATNPGPDGR
ncbi:MAG: DUF6114 domain-containing protein [Thermoplasmata archaeon]